MAERLTDDQVDGLLAILRKDTATIDAKVQYVTAVKSSIKQHNVPDSCVAPLFEGLRQASSSQHSALVNAGFTALNHLLTRLSRQEPKYLNKEAKHTLPLVVEKLGDQKDKFRVLGIQALVTMYAHVPIDVERFVRNIAMVGKNPRAKESSMQWLLQMHQEHGLQFRGYVPTLMELLEDADGMVRDVAKVTVIELFRDAPNAAKSDLKKQLKNFKVRPAIESAIIKELNPPTAKTETEVRPASAMQVRPNLAASVSSHAGDRPATPTMPEARAESVEPTYVNTQRELDEIIKAMHPWFEGKETEQNWLKREESMTKLRRLMAGNATTDYPDVFVSGCRGLLDGILKAVNSLRTSLSKEGCHLVQDLANTFGPAIDPMVELLMQSFIKLCAATKKISSQHGNVVVETLLGKTTYTVRLMQHIWAASQDKNVQPRLYTTGWLKTLIKKEAHHKSHLEHGGGVDLMEKCIKKGLNDPNPGVREKMRSTYWAFAAIWPARAEAIMNGLEGTAQKLLQKDPNNPNSPKKTEPVARPGLGFSKSTMTSSKPSIRETMLAQKKALASKNLPARPGSAMATISPVRQVSGGSSTSTASSAAHPATRTRPESSMKSHGGMSVAPMRPARRRPEMAARPATAGPYSVRTHDGPSAERTSPSASMKTKPANPKVISGSPKRTVPRPRPGHVATASESNINAPSPAKTPVPKPAAPPRMSPAKAKTTLGHFTSSSPSADDENLTYVVPALENARERLQTSSPADDIPPQEGLPLNNPLKMVDFPFAAQSMASLKESLQPSSPRIVVSPHRPSLAGYIASVEVASPPRVQPKPAPVQEVEKVDEPMPMPTETPEATPSKPVKVYEDPFVEYQTSTPRPQSDEPEARPALGDIPLNEDVAKVPQAVSEAVTVTVTAAEAEAEIENTELPRSPDKTRQNQNARLLDSGLARVKGQTLDVHGFRKLQSLIRENKLPLSDNNFSVLLVGLFEYLESPLDNLGAQKVQDVKAQVLATMKLLLKVDIDSFQPHVSRGLEALLRTRSSYDARTHMVSGLELLADELVRIGDADEITVTMTRFLGQMTLDTAGYRSLSMGLHVLRKLLESHPSFVPTDKEVAGLTGLASRCLESKESGVRMDAVQLCVGLHERLGDARFWNSMKGVRDDPKSLITYYVVKRQREAKSNSG
ncbi:ARM repeat-containing protein [Poronia punctata]|nr:ARM repeat-containing protein [Poronia punctata]